MGNPAFVSWLTASRGFFATWIVLRHLSANGTGPAAWIDRFVPHFRTFDIPTTYFFVLSGIIFTLGKPISLDWASVRKFWFARIGRLYPLYLIVVLASAPIGWKGAAGDWGVFLRSGLAEITLMQGWCYHDGAAHWLTVGWFMSSIAFCYFMYPLLAPFLRPRSDAFLAALILGLAGLTLSLAIYVDSHAGSPAIAELVRRTPAFPLLLFAIGISAGNLFGRGRRGLLIPIGLILALGGGWVLLRETPNGYHYLAGGALWLLPIAGLSFLRWAPPAWAVSYGELGFTLYMLHWPLYVYSRGILKATGLSEWLLSPLYLAIIMTVIIGLSRWVYGNFERPLQDYLKRSAKTSP